MYSQLLLLFGLVLLSAVFSAIEIALISLSKSKIDELVSKNVASARLLKRLKQNPHKLLVTVLIANNVINTGASAYSVIVFTDIFGSSGLGIATGVMTFFILVFGEIAPKSFAHQHAVAVSLWTAKFIYIVQLILYPLVWFFDGVVHIINRFTGTKDVYTVTEGELVAMLNIGAREGTIERQEKELIENVLEFNDIQVEEVMTPRVAVEALDTEMTLEEAVKYSVKNPHTRLPVYEKNLDNIVGILAVKDLLKYYQDYSSNKKLKSLKLLQPLEVPLSKKINKLFREFQRRHMHFAVVIDEYGGTAGIVTMEDLLEEIVGDIIDEFDPNQIPIQVINERNIIAAGDALVEDINDYFKMRFADNERDNISTMITEHLQRFPREGEVIKLERAKVLILEMDNHLVKKVKITKLKQKLHK
ncbi:MAG: hemolysin family protein [Patescibacteria group bacterium]